MSVHKVDPKLYQELKKFGAEDADACFNCGNCSAVCTLSEGQGSFPRRLIRYGQLGMKDKLLSSKETWLCWGCRDCSRTCPRQAKPSEYVEAVRRYTVSSYDPTTISMRLYTSGAFTAVFSILLAVAIALLLMTGGGRMSAGELALFEFVPYELVHNIGLVLIIGLGLVALWNIVAMTRRVSKVMYVDYDEDGDAPQISLFSRVIFATKELIAEVVAQKRFRSCDMYNDRPVILRPWFVHYTIMWGFFGLLAATILNFMFKDPYVWVPVYSPVRMLGTLAGIALVYGMTLTIIRKIRPLDDTNANMSPSDWLFLWLLWLGGVLGFLVEIAVYLPQGTLFGYIVFLAHVALAMELLILFPLTKFAHVIYRPLALWLLKYQQAPAAKAAELVEEAA